MLHRQNWEGKSVLLLQGPVGPYFKRLAAGLREAGATVYKLNFNGGDKAFFPDGEDYVGPADAVAARVAALIAERGIDAVALFGDCRPIHRSVGAACRSQGATLYVFEEGYFRPAYITCEPWGVNGYSSISRDPSSYSEDLAPVFESPPSPHSYFWWVVWAIIYWTACAVSTAYPGYQHHRRLTLFKEAGAWIRGVGRKYWYAWAERTAQDRLTTELRGRFFLVPLQVHNDAQIVQHSDYPDVLDFIEEVVASFAASAPPASVLVLKHHPMDRAYRDYKTSIEALAQRHHVEGRVIYIHDQHLPTLLDACAGVVVVNSTVGLSALHQGVPTKVTGRAFFDLPGLTSQRRLAEFWRHAHLDAPDMALYERFRRKVIRDTQINDNFNAPVQTGTLNENAGRARDIKGRSEDGRHHCDGAQAQGAHPSV